MVDKPSAVEIANAIKVTEYKYFGDYEMSDDQQQAVDVLVRFAQASATPANGEQVERIAELLMLYDLDHNGNWPMDKVRGALAYRDSEHSGDCTKQPWTCMRCACDEVYKVAHAIAATLSTPTEDARERVKVLEEASGLAWLAEHPRCALEHFGPVYGDDDDQSEGWRVMRENGSINDREWDEIGRGDTPAAAIAAARTALGNKETDRHG